MNELIARDGIIHEALLMGIEGNLCDALKMVDEAFAGFDAPWLKHCVKETVMRWCRDSSPSERDVYTWFERNYASIMGEHCKIVKRKTDGKNIPDFWICNGIEIIPVECKLVEFDKNALKQLQRYMSVYQCKSGIAVAHSLTVQLPPTITFIGFKVSELTPL